MWTCLISYNVLLTVSKRSKLRKSSENLSTKTRVRYYLAVFAVAFPGTALNIAKKSSRQVEANYGCHPGYESLGLWYEVLFTELLPISLGFLSNVFVFFQVRRKMARTAYPQSVRKRRKRIMYHYVIVCILCWAPTMLAYLLEICGVHSPGVEIAARLSLYLSGFLNLLVFGLQDPHLHRALLLLLHTLGPKGRSSQPTNPVDRAEHFLLRAGEAGCERSVMFNEASISSRADTSKSKKHMYRYRKLSPEDKLLLYEARPDLRPGPCDEGPEKEEGLKQPLLTPTTLTLTDVVEEEEEDRPGPEEADSSDDELLDGEDLRLPLPLY